MKPDWKDAPEWAQWLAMDEDGEWFWFERKPYNTTKIWLGNGGLIERAGQTQQIVWHESLEARP